MCLEVRKPSQEEKVTADEFPLVRKYSTYREFIRDWSEYKKKQRPGFSYRRFSALLGLKSPNFMQLVILGERNLSDELSAKMCRVMGLKGAQRAYFMALVHFEQARSNEDKERAEKQLLVATKKLVTNPIDKVRDQVVSEWYHMLVRELVLLPSFEPNGEYIAERLNHLITPEEAERSFRMLVQLGMIVQGLDGRFRPEDVAIDTGDYIFSRDQMEKHHGETLVTWGKNLSRLSPKEQELGLLHIPISSDKIPELRERIRKFQDEIVGWLCEETNGDRVVQLGTYMIPFDGLTRSDGKS